MQDFNFFRWVRDGVKQSVLLGVSDAIETIGSPDDPADLHPSMAALLQETSASRSGAPKIVSRGGNSNNRKRLGRSLKDIEPQT